jgi:hypothetical protein
MSLMSLSRPFWVWWIRRLWLAAKSLIRNGILLKKGFSQFECSHDIMRRRRQKEEQQSYENRHFRRLFCSRSRSSFMLVNTVVWRISPSTVYFTHNFEFTLRYRLCGLHAFHLLWKYWDSLQPKWLSGTWFELER